MENEKTFYQKQYEAWVPWLEDQYLYYFGKDNKASYATKQQLDKAKVTGVDQIDNLQDGVHNLAAGTVGKGGIAQPVGDLVSKEGVNRWERGGKDENGQVAPGPMNSVVNPLAAGAQGAATKLNEGAQGAAGLVGGIWGSKK